MQTKENYHHSLFVCISFCTFVPSRVITLKHNNEELRNTNGCYLVTQFSSNPTNRFILSELSFLAKSYIKNLTFRVCSDKIATIFLAQKARRAAKPQKIKKNYNHYCTEQKKNVSLQRKSKGY